MELSTIYKKAVLVPAVIAVAATVVYSVVYNYNYKSEWLTADFVIFYSILISVAYLSITSLLSRSIFFIKLPVVKASKILTFISWFLLPLTPVFIVMYYALKTQIGQENAFGDGFWYVVILNLPNVIGLVWGYYKYARVKDAIQTVAASSTNKKS
jgi:hypothetical protein